MATNETKKICDQAEGKVKTIVQNAIKAFDDRVSAMKGIEDTPSFVLQMAQTSVSSLLNGAKGELEKDARNFTYELKDAIKPISEKLASAIKGTADAEDIMYLVDKLETLAQITEPLDYTVKRYNIAVTSCHGCVVDEAKKWRDKVDNDPTIRKNILKAQLATNQSELARVQKELEANKKNVAKCRDEVSGILKQYNDRVAKVLLEAKTDYEKLLKAIEESQKQLLEKSKVRIETSELLGRASVFNRKEREASYNNAEDDYKNAYSKLNQLRTDLRNFANSTFSTQYGQIDKRIDELLSQIERINSDIASNETAIESHQNTIEGINGELNG